MRRLLFVLAATTALTACGDTWLGDNAPPPLPGKRVAILEESRSISPDPDADKVKVALPKPDAVADWPQPGGVPGHAMHHLAVAHDPLEKAWRVSIGHGGSKRQVFLSAPVVANGLVYAVDSRARLGAYDLTNGDRRWSISLAPDDDSDDGSYPGGLAFDDGKIYAVNGHAQLVTVSAKDGKVLWRQTLPAPVRGAPTVRAGRVLVITVDNETLALASDDGRVIWRHSGINEPAAFVGGSSPAVDGNTAIVPYSSGELFALRIENGVFLWGDALLSLRKTDQVATLNDIRGLPVIYDNVVYAAGNSDTLAAIDLRNGRRLWDKPIGSTQTPWLAGDYLYVLSNSAEVICLEASSGRVIWVHPLAMFADPDDKSSRISWSGPVLVSDRLLLTSSEGNVVSLSPYTGKEQGKISLPDGTHMSPIVANKTVLFITDDGDLLAYR